LTIYAFLLVNGAGKFSADHLISSKTVS